MHVNPYYEKLPGNSLFAEIARRVKAYCATHPDADVIKLGIGDVTRPLAPAVVAAMKAAADEIAPSNDEDGAAQVIERYLD